MPPPATARCWRRARPSTSWGSASATASPAPPRPRPSASASTSAAPAPASTRPATCSAPRRSPSRRRASGSSPPATTSAPRIRPAPPFEPVACDIFITEATFGLPVFRHPDPAREIARLLHSLAQFPERTHLVGVYALGKAQRLIRLLRDAGHAAPIYLHGALRRLCDYYVARGIDLGELPDATEGRGRSRDFAGQIVLGPPSAFEGPWIRRFADPLIGFASGWMQVRARARQRGVELPLILSDHCDWPELTATITELDPAEIWVTHGREEALVRWCALQGRPARPLHLVGYEDEADD